MTITNVKFQTPNRKNQIPENLLNTSNPTQNTLTSHLPYYYYYLVYIPNLVLPTLYIAALKGFQDDCYIVSLKV